MSILDGAYWEKEMNEIDRCPICEYSFKTCQCRYGGSAHPDRSKRRRVVLDHLYFYTPNQRKHVIELEKFWQISYGDPEMEQIFESEKRLYDLCIKGEVT